MAISTPPSAAARTASEYASAFPHHDESPFSVNVPIQLFAKQYEASGGNVISLTPLDDEINDNGMDECGRGEVGRLRFVC